MLQNVTVLVMGKKPRQSYYTISDETLHKPDTVKDMGIIFDIQFISIIKSTSLCGRDGRTVCGPLCVPKST